METSPTGQPLAFETALCRQAQRAWASTPLSVRLKLIQKLRHGLVGQRERLCQAVFEDLGRKPEETLPAELFGLAAACRYLEHRAARILAPCKIPWRDRPMWLFRQSDSVQRRPRGIVGIIGTWNFPIYLNGIQILQALTAGNGVIWKPSERAPRSAAALTQWLRSVEWPDGLWHALPADRTLGPVLVEADIDHLVFTGHVETGRRLAKRLGERLISSTLELSGHDAMFVLDDADVELAAKAAWFGFTVNAGQTCIAVRRVFIAKTLYPRFLDRISQLLSGARPMTLVSEQQKTVATELIADAVHQGARLLQAETSQPVDAKAMHPVILADLKPGMKFLEQDLFAPLMGVMPYDDLSEALEVNAQCPFALGGSIFTSDRRRAEQLASRLGMGQITINDVIAPAAHPATPLSGRRASGWGVTQGREGLLEMTIPQSVSIKKGRLRPHYQPVGSSRMSHPKLFEALFEWDHGQTMRQRFKGLWRMFRWLLFGKV